MNKGYHIANFNLPQFNPAAQNQTQQNTKQPVKPCEQTMIIYGNKGTGKSTILKQAISDCLRGQLFIANNQNNHLTYQMSAIEVQSGEKVVCLFSQRNMEVTEDRHGYFHVHLDDFFQMNCVLNNASEAKDSTHEVEKCVAKLARERKGHLLILIQTSDPSSNEYNNLNQRFQFVELAAPSHEPALRDLNRSLSTLDQCLTQLANFKQEQTKAPFRNSKLTKILKRSLLKSQVQLIVCVAQGPAEKYQETLTSFQFAQRIHKVPTPIAPQSNKLVSLDLDEQSNPQLQEQPQAQQLTVTKQKKSVRFELPIEKNDLDSSLRERLQHNMLYKDDTIFQHMSFFQDLESDQEIIQAAKVTKKKDVFLAKTLLGKPVEVSDEEDSQEDEDLSNLKSMSQSPNLSLSIEQINQNATNNISCSLMFHSFLLQDVKPLEKLKESDLLMNSDASDSYGAQGVQLQRQSEYDPRNRFIQCQDEKSLQIDQNDLSGFIQNMSLIQQLPESYQDQRDTTQPIDLILELNKIPFSYENDASKEKNLDFNDVQQDQQERILLIDELEAAVEQQQSSLMLFGDEEQACVGQPDQIFCFNNNSLSSPDQSSIMPANQENGQISPTALYQSSQLLFKTEQTFNAVVQPGLIERLRETLTTIQSLEPPSQFQAESSLTQPKLSQDMIQQSPSRTLSNRLQSQIENLMIETEEQPLSNEETTKATELVSAITQQITNVRSSFVGMHKLVKLLNNLKAELHNLQVQLNKQSGDTTPLYNQQQDDKNNEANLQYKKNAPSLPTYQQQLINQKCSIIPKVQSLSNHVLTSTISQSEAVQPKTLTLIFDSEDDKVYVTTNMNQQKNKKLNLDSQLNRKNISTRDEFLNTQAIQSCHQAGLSLQELRKHRKSISCSLKKSDFLNYPQSAGVPQVLITLQQDKVNSANQDAQEIVKPASTILNQWLPPPNPRFLKSRAKQQQTNKLLFQMPQTEIAVAKDQIKSPYLDESSENLNDVSESSLNSSSRQSMQKYLMQLIKPM